MSIRIRRSMERKKCTLSSHSRGKCSKISNGFVSAANTMNSHVLRFNVLVAIEEKKRNNQSLSLFFFGKGGQKEIPSFAPFLICAWCPHCCTRSRILFVSSVSANGYAFGFTVPSTAIFCSYFLLYFLYLSNSLFLNVPVLGDPSPLLDRVNVKSSRGSSVVGSCASVPSSPSKRKEKVKKKYFARQKKAEEM